MTGHVQKAVLLALLDLGVAGVSAIATHAGTTTASVFTALASLQSESLIAVAPIELQDEDSRKGARQYGLTHAGIDAAIEFEDAKA